MSEETGKYRKILASRILDTNGKLSFGIYRDKGIGRDNKFIPSEYHAPLFESCVSDLVEEDVNPFFIVYEENGQQLIWTYESTPYIADHSLDGYVYKRKPLKRITPSITISQLTLFSGIEDNRVTVPASMIQPLIEKYFVPLTRQEQVQAWLDNNPPPVYNPLPRLPIADCRFTQIAHVPASAYRLEEKNSFRDNLR